MLLCILNIDIKHNAPINCLPGIHAFKFRMYKLKKKANQKLIKTLYNKFGGFYE